MAKETGRAVIHLSAAIFLLLIFSLFSVTLNFTESMPKEKGSHFWQCDWGSEVVKKAHTCRTARLGWAMLTLVQGTNYKTQNPSAFVTDSTGRRNQLLRSQVFGDEQSQSLWKEEAVIASFCTHSQHLHWSKCNVMPLLLSLILGVGVAPNPYGSEALVLDMNSHLLRTSSSLYAFVQAFLGSPRRGPRRVKSEGRIRTEGSGKKLQLRWALQLSTAH